MALSDYIYAFAHLHTDASPTRWSAATCHCAPHKPLLLLAVMDLFAQASIPSNLVDFVPELGELFTIYWAKVMPLDRRGNIVLPFFHLKSDGFWHLVPQPGKEAVLDSARQIRSINQLRDTVLGAELDQELYSLLCVEEPRNLLRTVLVETYFAPEIQNLLVAQSLTNMEAFRYSQALLAQARTQAVKECLVNAERYQPAARDQGFRRAVVSAYEHRCALCGNRVRTPDGHTIVDAAHIVP